MAKSNCGTSTPASAASAGQNGIKHESSGGNSPNHDQDSAPLSSDVKREYSISALESTPLAAIQLKSSRSPSPAIDTKPTSNDFDTLAKSESQNGSLSPVKSEMPKPKASRAASSKAPPRVAPLFDHLPDVTTEATAAFQVITSSTYQNKYLGFTEAALECDCAEVWDPATRTNNACGEHSDCINRATKMECGDDCNCGMKCQNQRFTRKMYADVSVIQTEKKGYGLRTNTDLHAGDFIFEYIGEVIAEGAFRKRMIAYDDEGIKHFYFMSLSRGEFVDATKRGNLGRFCNHSCNPNCYVDKWVVGDKLRMGIFAERYVKAGEELVFNYNVDRYGANPQPCYCGESNCTGFIGGKTQTERGTKLSAATIEALGIEDDEWDTVVAKKPKKRKTAEDDEDYVESVPTKALDADGVTKVMAALMQCKEKWIAVKLLARIQNSNDDMVRHRILKLHGYRILNSQLAAWKEDENIILQILDILESLPRLTRNKIVDARLDQTLDTLAQHEDGRVASRASALSEAYSKLELAYRIPRRKEDPTAVKTESSVYDRREAFQRRRSRSRSKTPPPKGPANIVAPTGPKSLRPAFIPRPFPPRAPPPLPSGWKIAYANGRAYFYTDKGITQWHRPTQAADAPPPPPKEPSQQDVLKGMLESIVKPKQTDVKTPESAEPSKKEKEKEKKEEKWKSYDDDKKMKLYENTLFPHISHVMNKYKHKIPRDDLKRFAKEIAKKLVASDFKANRVTNPTKIDDKQQRKVKEYCRQFFDKAASKHKKHEDDRSARRSKDKHSKSISNHPASPVVKSEYADEDEDIKMSDHELDDVKPTPVGTPSDTGQGTKRKREHPSPVTDVKQEDTDTPQSPLKKPHLDDPSVSSTIATPPPPPPPPDTPIESTPGENGTPFTGHNETAAGAEGDIEMEIDAPDGDDSGIVEQEGGKINGSNGITAAAAAVDEVKTQAEVKAAAHSHESKFQRMNMSVRDVRALAQMGDEGDGDDGEEEVEW